MWITFTEDLKTEYVDEDGNLQFPNFYLEQNVQVETVEPKTSLTDESIIKNAAKLKKIWKELICKFLLEKASADWYSWYCTVGTDTKSKCSKCKKIFKSLQLKSPIRLFIRLWIIKTEITAANYKINIHWNEYRSYCSQTTKLCVWQDLQRNFKRKWRSLQWIKYIRI